MSQIRMLIRDTVLARSGADEKPDGSVVHPGWIASVQPGICFVASIVGNIDGVANSQFGHVFTWILTASNPDDGGKGVILI